MINMRNFESKKQLLDKIAASIEFEIGEKVLVKDSGLKIETIKNIGISINGKQIIITYEMEMGIRPYPLNMVKKTNPSEIQFVANYESLFDKY